MRNLRILRQAVPIFTDQLLPLSATTWDTSSNQIICAFGPSANEALIELKRVTGYGPQADEKLITIATWDAPCPNPDLECDKILDLHYFPDKLTTCLVLAGGDIVVVREQPLDGEESIEMVGSVDAGISAASWSPDEELLALSTNAGTVLYMSRDFDPVVDIAMTPEDVSVSNHVSVGWGKAETQFKGKRARALRDPTVPEYVDEGVLSSLDDRSTGLSWRGDGAYLAVNSVETENRRIVRIYSRDGVIDSVSEPVDNLEGALSWRPSGNVIAGIKRKAEDIEVVFFERNGLVRRGGFSIRLKSGEKEDAESPISLSWNTDSTILAVSLHDRVQFWTTGNYHWYLKQEIKVSFDTASKNAVAVNWHPEKALRVCIHCQDQIQDTEFVSTTTGGTTLTPNDYGLVAVIDGATVKVTPLRLANVPPPVSLHEVTADKNIKDAAIAPSGKHLAILNDSEVLTFEYLDNKRPRAPRLLSRRKIKLENAVPRQIALRDDERIFVLADDTDTGNSICWHGDNSGDISLDGVTPLPGNASQIFLGLDKQQLCVLSSNGDLEQYQDNAGVLDLTEQTRFPTSIATSEVVVVNEESIAFGLSPGGNLYANDRLLVRNCTSFLVTPAHLVFTTTQHLLKFVHLTSVADLDVPADEPEADERCRRIERGARLVTAMPTTYSVVLQMPRGNLETIFPRAMVLDGIRRSIDKLGYRTAFLACRAQRVDMNILYDHSPEQFLQNVGTFIKQLDNAGYLDLFVSQLREEDVTVSMYRDTSNKVVADGQRNDIAVNGTAVTNTTNSIAKEEGKVNRICDAILKELEKSAEAKTQNIITAHVCKNPPDLDAGLTVIGEIQKSDPDRAEKAAEHICFLADVNQLYDSALGLYNLDLTLLIAQQSQKDPREYLPYMQSLQELDPLRRSFQIDDKLNRRTKALMHLYILTAFEEFKSYTQKHQLYNQALELVKYQPDQLREVMRLYADHLNSTDQFKEAGIAYDYLQDHVSAVSAYRAAHLWRESLTSAHLVPLPPTALHALAHTLADSLLELKDFSSAAQIHLDYLADAPTAARLLCRGNHFAEAMRILALRSLTAEFPTIIDPGLVDASGAMTELLADFKAQLAAQVPRLRDLRVKKAADPLAFFGGDPSALHGDGGADIPDNVSLASTAATTSGGTFMTRYTGQTGTAGTGATRRTSKNRRREERKRARGKKGSVYEEEYIVASVGRLIERVNATGAEVERLVEGLVRRGMRERAVAVQELMAEVVGMCKGCVGEVYLVEEKKKVVEGEDGEEDGERPQGAQGVLWDAVQEAQVKREPPIVKAFERLSLV